MINGLWGVYFLLTGMTLSFFNKLETNRQFLFYSMLKIIFLVNKINMFYFSFYTCSNNYMMYMYYTMLFVYLKKARVSTVYQTWFFFLLDLTNKHQISSCCSSFHSRRTFGISKGVHSWVPTGSRHCICCGTVPHRVAR